MYQVFTDGSSSRKQGTIGTSYVLFEEKNFIKDFHKGFIDNQARNGIAELLGVYYILFDICEKLNLNKNQEIIIYSDSQYVVNEFNIWFKSQLEKNFFETKNKEVIIYILWLLYILRNEGYIIKFKWIKGHQIGENFEIVGNNIADELAVSSHKKIDINTLDNIENFVQNLKIELKKENIFNFVKENYLM